MKSNLLKKASALFVICICLCFIIGESSINSYAASAQSNKTYITQTSFNMRCARDKRPATNETVNPVFPGYKTFTKDSLLSRVGFQSFDANGVVIPNSSVTVDEAELQKMNDAISQKYQFFDDGGFTAKPFVIAVSSPNGYNGTITVTLMRGGDVAQFQAASLKLDATDVVYDLDKGELTWDQLKSSEMGNVYGYYPELSTNTYFKDNPPATIGADKYLNDLNTAIKNKTPGTYTVYAIWETNAGASMNAIQPFTVTLFRNVKVDFDSKGGSAIDSISTQAGKAIAKPADPTKDGSTFQGWYTDEAYTKAWDFTNDTVTDNMTLYAKWNSMTDESGNKDNDKNNNNNNNNNNKDNNGANGKGSSPRTGDYTNLLMWMALLSAGLVSFSVLEHKKERS